MSEQTVEIVNALGLHARAAARFVRTATEFQSEIRISKEDTTIDGKSILAILFLAAAFGTTITISAKGIDEQEALAALVRLVAEGLGEDPVEPKGAIG